MHRARSGRGIGPRWPGVLVAIALLATSCTSATESGGEGPQRPAASATIVETPSPTVTESPEPTASAFPAPPTEIPATTPTPGPTAAPTTAPTPVPIGELMDAAYLASRLDATTCPSSFDASVDCSTATLPLRHASPDDGERVEVAVAYVDNGDPLGIGPVVFFQGGPGFGGTPRASSYVGADFDVLFFDPRGTGRSHPKLDCPEVDELWALERTDDEAQRIDDEVTHAAYERCAERLRGGGIDLDAFHTDAVAADAELLRRLFGFDEWSVWGISYGARVALTAMRDHPEAIRAAVLDSVVPFEVDFFATLTANGLRAFEALDAACDVTSCVDRHGDFGTALAELARRLEQEPTVIDVERPSGGGTLAYRVDGGELLGLVFGQLYSTRDLVSLPRQVTRADFGGLNEIVNAYVRRRDPARVDLALAAYYTTWCREEQPFHDPAVDDVALAELAETYGVDVDDALGVDAIGRLCGYFDVEPAPPVVDQPLDSDIPTIVFAGAFDPITPPEWSRQVADRLPNGIYVEMPNHGHGMTTACPHGLQRQFLQRPAEPLDLTCVDETGGPAFD